MSKRLNMILVCAALPLFHASCTTPIDDGSSDTGNTNTTDNSSSGEDAGTAEKYRLTINWDGEGFGSSQFGAAVWVFVGDDTILRADGKYSEGPDTFRYIKSANNPSTTQAYDIEAGKSVTLVAFEGGGQTLNLYLGAVPADSSETNNIEFLEWSGDINATPETGVATVLMDADKEVTVTFAPMPTLTINVEGSGFFNVSIETPEWLNDPSLGTVSPSADCSGDECTTQCVGSSEFGGEALFYAFKGGTIITLTSDDCLEAQLDWSMWDKAGCGGRECTFQLGSDSDATAIWIEK